MASLLVKIVWSAVRHPRGYWGAVLEDLHATIRKSWLPLTVGIFGFLMMVAILAVQFLDMVGASYLFGPVIYLQSTRSYSVWITSVAMIGIVGAALTADVGARQVREELDAMQVMGVDPIREIAVPRVISITLMTTLLSVPALLVTLFSMQVSGAFVTGLRSGDMYSNVFTNITAIDVASPVINSALIGLLIGTVCCYKGFAAEGGASGLGKAVNQAVVFSLIGMFVLQLAFMSIYLGLFPELGAYR